MIAPSGIFDYRNDDPTNLRQYFNLLVLDFDDFGSHEAAGEFKERLIQYANPLHLYAVWFSPGNKGVKAAMVHDNTNPDHHYNLFRQVKLRLYPRTDEFDKGAMGTVNGRLKREATTYPTIVRREEELFCLFPLFFSL